ncbi:hypothetical protein ACFC3A_12445 [Enterococcus thailandicus]|uniref:hypothetical protein n=1 Tax=Enterococcus thailandicus TaxID=417368 RepID=UPI0039A415BD
MAKRLKRLRKKIHEDIKLIFYGKPLLKRITLWILVLIVLIDIFYRFIATH